MQEYKCSPAYCPVSTSFCTLGSCEVVWINIVWWIIHKKKNIPVFLFTSITVRSRSPASFSRNLIPVFWGYSSFHLRETSRSVILFYFNYLFLYKRTRLKFGKCVDLKTRGFFLINIIYVKNSLLQRLLYCATNTCANLVLYINCAVVRVSIIIIKYFESRN